MPRREVRGSEGFISILRCRQEDVWSILLNVVRSKYGLGHTLLDSRSHSAYSFLLYAAPSSHASALQSSVAGLRLEQGNHGPMRHVNRWSLLLVLILPMAISGCGTSRGASPPLLADNARFMDMWGIYTHCSHSEDLEAMRVDAQQLSLAVDVMDPAADPIPSEREELAPVESSVRLSADPAAMAAACALRAGQVAQERGRRSFAREMFQMIVTKFPQPRYRYYVSQAREGLESLDAATSG
jgi:hypothetical protein